MIQWLNLSTDQRIRILEIASEKTGINPKAIEKDWWVTLILKAIFQTEFSSHLLFKGGTSLSKCWKIIERFSEDIDIAVDRELLGLTGTLTNTKIKQLKRAACAFTSGKLLQAVEFELHRLGTPKGMITITAGEISPNHPDKDPQQLYITYPSLYGHHTYLKEAVVIEVSALSLAEPSGTCNVQSILSEHFTGKLYSETPFAVQAVDPRRTFLEKLFLLHEEFQKDGSQRPINTYRMSRHLYDIIQLMGSNYADAALSDQTLYKDIIAHRQHYYHLPWVDYEKHDPAWLNFLPHPSVSYHFHSDYREMQLFMIYGTSPKFSDLLRSLWELQKRLRKIADPSFTHLFNLEGSAVIGSDWSEPIPIDYGYDVLVDFATPGVNVKIDHPIGASRVIPFSNQFYSSWRIPFSAFEHVHYPSISFQNLAHGIKSNEVRFKLIPPTT